MREDEYLQCINFGLLIKDKIHNQTIPIVLAIGEEEKRLIEESAQVVLVNGDGGDHQLKNRKSITLTYNSQPVAILDDYEIFVHRKEERAAAVFKTTNPGHPSVRMIMDSGDWLIGGDLKVFRKITWGDGLDDYRLKPSEIRSRLKAMQVRRKALFWFFKPKTFFFF